MTRSIQPQQSAGSGWAVDLGLLASFMKEFNVLLRHSLSYPKGHPIVEAFIQRTLHAYARLMQTCDKLPLGIAKDTLMLDGLSLDRKHVVFQEFARTFFSRGVGVVTLLPELSPEELRRILIIFRVRPEELKAHGGIEEIWNKAKISAMEVRGFRFELFTKTEDGSIGAYGEILWERLVRGLLEDTLALGGATESCFDPEIVADILNGKYAETGAIPDGCELMTVLVKEEAALNAVSNPVLFQKLGVLISRLTPEMRCRFLHSSAEISRADGSVPLADLLEAMDPETVVNLLHESETIGLKTPSLLVQLVQKLASHTPSATNNSSLSDQEAKERMMNLFRERGSEQYVPPEYQRKLHAMMSQQVVTRSPDELGELMQSLDDQRIQERLGEIILHLAGQSADEHDMAILSQNMEEMCLYLLETGEYHQVLVILRRAMDPVFPDRFRELLFKTISRPEFLEEILNGLTIWGKSRYDDIRALVRAIGAPFVDPLLDRLANEEKLSLRRFIIDRLTEVGPLARTSLLARLEDPRWYFVRNVLIVLRAFGDSSLASHIRPLIRHPHEMVCQEALRTLQQLRDPTVDRHIVANLENPDRKVQLSVIGLARKSHSAEVVRSLAAIVTRSGLSPADVELKCAAVQSLGEIGNPLALDELATVLHSSTLVRSKALSRLKEEIVRSLASYPPPAALSALKPLLHAGHPLRGVAVEVEKMIKVKADEG